LRFDNLILNENDDDDKMSSCGSNAGMETTAPVVNVIVKNAVFHSNLHISQTPPQIIHILGIFFW